jgi:hypothetical protein
LPNFDPAWLVLTIPAAIIASGIWQSRQAEIRRRKDAREAKERIAQQNKPKPQSPDFAALIYAIATESDANRDEEKREEGGTSCIPSFGPLAGVGMKESPAAPGFPKRIGHAAIPQ